jgi:hypothetical protein
MDPMPIKKSDGKKRSRETVFQSSSGRRLVVAKLKETMSPKVRYPKYTTFDVDVLDWESVIWWSEAFGKSREVESGPGFVAVSTPKSEFEAMKHTEKMVYWRVGYQKYAEFEHLFTKEDCCRNVGKQCTFILFNQTTEKDKLQPFEITLIGKRLYEYETSDSYGLDVIPSSITIQERYYLTFKYRLFFTKTEIKKKLQ